MSIVDVGTLQVEENLDIRTTVAQLIMPMLRAISLAHCKNVELTAVEPPQWKQRKARKKKGKPLHRHHVLTVDPATPKRGGEATGTGGQRAVHICRGSFATYSEEQPLFGKVSGTFWRPAHVKGSRGEGIVTKDYEVQAA